MATAHDRKVGILLCAFLGLPRSIDLSSTYSASWISRHRLIFDLFSTQISRRRLIRQLASSCSTSGRQGKSRMSTYSDLLATYVDFFQEVRIPTFLSRGRQGLILAIKFGPPYRWWKGFCTTDGSQSWKPKSLRKSQYVCTIVHFQHRMDAMFWKTLLTL